MIRDWPEKLDPPTLAEQEALVTVSASISELPRVRVIATRDDTEICARMKFNLHSSGFPKVQGQINGQLEVRCERCLQMFSYPLDECFELLLVVEGQKVFANLLELFDIFEYENTIDTVSMLEDQIILALPLVFKHDNLHDCDPMVRQWMQDKTEFEKQMDKPNPFAVLKKLDP